MSRPKPKTARRMLDCDCGQGKFVAGTEDDRCWRCRELASGRNRVTRGAP